MGSLRVDFCRQLVISPTIFYSLSVDTRVLRIYSIDGCHDFYDLEFDDDWDFKIDEIIYLFTCQYILLYFIRFKMSPF